MPPKTIGRYKIIAEIGPGGYSTVYQAHDPRSTRDVAIKVLPDAVRQDPERLARFRREAKAAAMLKHPRPKTQNQRP